LHYHIKILFELQQSGACFQRFFWQNQQPETGLNGLRKLYTIKICFIWLMRKLSLRIRAFELSAGKNRLGRELN